MNDTIEKVRIRYADTQVYLDYEVPILREILDSIRNEASSPTATLLREYESKLIEAERLDKIREADRQQKLIDETIRKDIE